MKIVLPDSSELELPDGATGRDAAAAIGPKLAEQAVLVRSNGRVQDLRLPLEDGQRIQILTTRDKVDTADGQISFYTQGDFTDLCRGPHLQDSKPIKALKLTGLAGAYWRGDEHNKQLTRIYGTAFYSRDALEAHLQKLEEARRRDHRRLGTQLDLFHLDETSPGSPFWHPKGMVIWNALEDLRRSENLRRGYLEVRTPPICDKS